MPMKKSLGKPYAGKPHVRFDEGVTKLTSFVSFVLYSTGRLIFLFPQMSLIFADFVFL